MSTEAAPNKSFTRFFPVIARVLLGLMFFVFGLNGFFFFIPPPPADQMPKALLDFSTAMMSTGFLFKLVKGTEVVCGLLLLLNRFVPLALVLLAPVIVNIVLVHAFLAPSGVGMGLVILALECYLAWAYRSAFRPMLAARATPD